MARDDSALITRLLSAPLEDLLAEARMRRDGRGAARMTYSPKVFIPLTRLCADVCHYCTFATTPSRLEAPYLTEDEVLEIARRHGMRLVGDWNCFLPTGLGWLRKTEVEAHEPAQHVLRPGLEHVPADAGVEVVPADER